MLKKQHESNSEVASTPIRSYLIILSGISFRRNILLLAAPSLLPVLTQEAAVRVVVLQLFFLSFKGLGRQVNMFIKNCLLSVKLSKPIIHRTRCDRPVVLMGAQELHCL